MSSEREHLVDAARRAWERGHSILVRLANQILAEHGINEEIERQQHELPDDYAEQLRSAYVELMKHLRPLEPYLEDISLLDDATLWLLGDLDVGDELRKLNKNCPALGRVESLVRFAGQDRPGWERKDWLNRWVEPMRQNAETWRNRLREPAGKRKRQKGVTIADVARVLTHGDRELAAECRKRLHNERRGVSLVPIGKCPNRKNADLYDTFQIFVFLEEINERISEGQKGQLRTLSRPPREPDI